MVRRGVRIRKIQHYYLGGDDSQNSEDSQDIIDNYSNQIRNEILDNYYNRELNNDNILDEYIVDNEYFENIGVEDDYNDYWDSSDYVYENNQIEKLCEDLITLENYEFRTKNKSYLNDKQNKEKEKFEVETYTPPNLENIGKQFFANGDINVKKNNKFDYYLFDSKHTFKFESLDF